VVTLLRHFRQAEARRNGDRHLLQKLRVIGDYLSGAGVYLPAEITADSIEAYLADQRLAGRSAKTLVNKRADIGRFCHWLERHGELDANPIHRVDPPKVPQTEIVYLDEAEFAVALAIAERSCPPALVALLTGARLGEIMALRWSDIRPGRGGPVICFGSTVPTKTNRVRSVPLHPRLAALLARLGPGRPEARIFPRRCRRTWARLLREFKQAIPKMARHGGGWNIFRHTFASLLVLRGERISVVSKLLGHASITTTQRFYAHLDCEWGRAAVGRL